MSKLQKIYEKVMSGQSDANLNFSELCHLLQKLGYSANFTKGSHILFKRGASFLNLQAKGSNAKNYQVAQVREELKKLNIKPE